MIFPKIPLAQGVIELIRAYNIKHIVISPGSRNAPLTIGFSENDNFKCYSIVDERCAAFFALGIAQQIHHPVALVCTSGSALLNYYPAFSEAFYSQIPLVVLSADRPVDKIDIGDGQTIRQTNVFEKHSLYNANLSENWSEVNSKQINEALATAIADKGPVHINIPFEEPLYDTISELTIEAPIRVSSLVHQTIIPQRIWNTCIESWEEGSKKLILIGCNPPNSIAESVIQNWVNDPSVVVMTEVTSNCSHESFINCIDQLITPFDIDAFEAFKPDILITIGGMVVSKRIKQFLRKYMPEEHWHIDPLRAYDTYGCLSQHLKVTPDYFFTELYDSIITNNESTYKTFISSIKTKRIKSHINYLEQCEYSDLLVFQNIIAALPTVCQLQLSNSSTIRYAQLFDITSSVAVYCNRGTSGIDGSSSTAIGASVVDSKPVILITGDISFLYDSNALWNTYIPDTFKIIVINNAGGGIFRILPGHKESPIFNTYFETQHNLDASHLSQMYGFDYISINQTTELKDKLPDFFSRPKRSIMEIFTPTAINDNVLLTYFKSL